MFRFTPPDFQAKHFMPLISQNFNSFSRKKHKKWVKMEKFTPLAKILHCHRQWRHGQIPPLQWWMFSILARFEAFLILFFFLLGGRSEYWDAIAIMEYKDRASFCRMVSLKSLCFPISLVIFYFFICFIFGRFSAMSGARCWNTRSLVWQTLTPILRRQFQDWLDCPF